MTLNCEIGDLAILVKDPDSGKDLGKIVRVVENGDDWSHEGDSRHHWACDTLGQHFTCDRPVICLTDGIELIDIPDEYLRPIRDTDGEDESLSWVTPPNKETCNV